MIQRLLRECEPDDPTGQTQATVACDDQATAVEELRAKPDFKRGNGQDRYFLILAWLDARHGTEFREIALTYSRGRRVQFAADPKTIEESGRSTKPARVPGTEIYAVTNLSNDRKAKIIEDVLRSLGYPITIIQTLVQSILELDSIRRQRLQQLTEAYA